MLALVAVAAGFASGADERVQIAPGVYMPWLNFGVSNRTMWLELGGRGVDTALVYGDPDQRETGQALRESKLARSEVFITTKVPCCPMKAFNAQLACAATNTTADVEHDLAMLGVGYVDLMLLRTSRCLERPPASPCQRRGAPPAARLASPVADRPRAALCTDWPCDDFEHSVAAYKALEPLVFSGKARAIGVSNFNASALDALLGRVTVRPAVNQCGFSIAGHNHSLWGRDTATRQRCKERGVQYAAWAPLGHLTEGGTAKVLNNPVVKSVAAAHNKSTAQVALRWVVQQGVVAVTGSNKAAHDTEDLEVLDFALSDDDMARLSAV